MTPSSIEFTLRTESQLSLLAQCWLPHWQAQMQPLVMYLQGDLGSGKTTLCRHVLRQLGWQGPVKSPTYTLVEPYDLPGCRVLHLDLYRLHSTDTLQDLGLRDAFAQAKPLLMLIEWPQQVSTGLPPADLCWQLHSITDAPLQRRLSLTAYSPLGHSLLQPMQLLSLD